MLSPMTRRHAWPLLSLSALLGCGQVTTVDAGQDAGRVSADVDVVGTWHACDTTIVYGPDGRTTGINHRQGGCTARGTYVVEGDIVTTTWTDPGCGFGPESRGRQTIRLEDGILSIDPESGSYSRRANGDTTEHHLYRIEGMETGQPEPGVTILSVVGDPSDDFGSGCYWSEDDMCGGIFSCSGNVEQWRFEEGRLNGSTSCGGGCPCGAVVSGDIATDGSITGDFNGVNCDRTYAGTFTATPLEW